MCTVHSWVCAKVSVNSADKWPWCVQYATVWVRNIYQPEIDIRSMMISILAQKTNAHHQKAARSHGNKQNISIEF